MGARAIRLTYVDTYRQRERAAGRPHGSVAISRCMRAKAERVVGCGIQLSVWSTGQTVYQPCAWAPTDAMGFPLATENCHVYRRFLDHKGDRRGVSKPSSSAASGGGIRVGLRIRAAVAKGSWREVSASC